MRTGEDKILKKPSPSHSWKEWTGFYTDNSTNWSNHPQHIRCLNADELLREDAVLQARGCRGCQGPLPGARPGGGSILSCSGELPVWLPTSSWTVLAASAAD